MSSGVFVGACGSDANDNGDERGPHTSARLGWRDFRFFPAMLVHLVQNLTHVINTTNSACVRCCVLERTALRMSLSSALSVDNPCNVVDVAKMTIWYGILLVGVWRKVVVRNDSVTKFYEGRKNFSYNWLGMNEAESFRHEANVMSHIEQMRPQCPTGSANVCSVVRIDYERLSITTRRYSLGRKLTRRCVSEDLLNKTLQNISFFLRCAKVVHCDIQPKNIMFGPPKTLYLIDMDMAYIIGQRRAGQKCTETMETAWPRFTYYVQRDALSHTQGRDIESTLAHIPRG